MIETTSPKNMARPVRSTNEKLSQEFKLEVRCMGCIDPRSPLPPRPYQVLSVNPIYAIPSIPEKRFQAEKNIWISNSQNQSRILPKSNFAKVKNQSQILPKSNFASQNIVKFGQQKTREIWPAKNSWNLASKNTVKASRQSWRQRWGPKNMARPVQSTNKELSREYGTASAEHQ